LKLKKDIANAFHPYGKRRCATITLSSSFSSLYLEKGENPFNFERTLDHLIETASSYLVSS